MVLIVLALNLLLDPGPGGLGRPAHRCAWFGPRGGDAGARLHRRFVGLFALAAVAPAVVVALFFGVLVTRGVENWFSQRGAHAWSRTPPPLAPAPTSTTSATIIHSPGRARWPTT